jgi:MFS family permease
MSEVALIAGEHGGVVYGQAYGLFNVAFSAGFMIGPLWGGYITGRLGGESWWGVLLGWRERVLYRWLFGQGAGSTGEI